MKLPKKKNQSLLIFKKRDSFIVMILEVFLQVNLGRFKCSESVEAVMNLLCVPAFYKEKHVKFIVTKVCFFKCSSINNVWSSSIFSSNMIQFHLSHWSLVPVLFAGAKKRWSLEPCGYVYVFILYHTHHPRGEWLQREEKGAHTWGVASFWSFPSLEQLLAASTVNSVLSQQGGWVDVEQFVWSLIPRWF